ncbi:hypothetical protein LTR99_009197 [Exophiala xenobiotica]|uniref:Heterokaryon incompatibility domain-containing protein n=1 Tax=Vermiconidia calcicola TaxID=1690605 RepID=A0AAV9Q3Y8_9PEZI|nr:hypothetical protein LTR99_009197 [Exophiala xenobiotica]KAK5532463.1 hypothetical protein LTR25_007996 [Vermiconidia calcicola]
MGDDKTKLAFEFVSRLASISTDLKASGVTYSRIPNNWPLLERFGLKTALSERSFTAVMTLLEHDWFERIWIVQEVVVSNLPRVIQGNQEVLWGDFAAALIVLHDLRATTSASVRGVRSSRVVNWIEDLRQLFHQGKFTELKRLTQLFRDSKSTDPRDKIYALVGIAGTVSKTNQPSLSLFSYEGSVSDAFRLWTIYTLQTEKSLEILSAVNTSKSYRSTITYSWVPDWDAANDEHVRHPTIWPSEKFHASNSSDADIYFRDEEKVLAVTGHPLERIEEVGCEMYIPDYSRSYVGFLSRVSYLQQVLRSWEATARLRTHRRYRDTSESIWDVYWQTLLFGVHGFRHEEIEQVRGEFNDFFAAYREPWILAELLGLHWSKHLLAFYTAILLLLRGFQDLFVKFEFGRSLAFSSRCKDMGGRRMVRMESGYIGLAVQAAQTGDYVYLFKGARMPFLGLGYEFVRQLRDRPGAVVFATSRDPAQATRLSSLTDKGNVHIVKITKQPESIDEALAAAETVRKLAGKVDVVIANAGIIGHETSIADAPMDMYQQFLDVNLLNNIAIFKALRPLMLESARQGGTPKFVAISTQYGSLNMVEDLPGQSSAYAISKAALNMFIRHVAYEEKKNGIVAFPIHPGVVATETVAELARRIGLATIEPEESIQGMMKIVDGMTVEDEVRLWKYDGTHLPW